MEEQYFLNEQMLLFSLNVCVVPDCGWSSKGGILASGIFDIIPTSQIQPLENKISSWLTDSLTQI